VVICNFWHPGTLTLSDERQSARMTKITNDRLTRFGTGCFIAVHVATVGVIGLKAGLLTRPWAHEAKAEAKARKSEAEVEAEATESEAEAKAEATN